MSVVVSFSSINPILCGHPKSGLQQSNLKLQMKQNPNFPFHSNGACIQRQCRNPSHVSSTTCLRNEYVLRGFVPIKVSKTEDSEVLSLAEPDNAVDFDWTEEDDEGSPWEGAIVYRRKSSISHVEYCTTLERLGMGKVSSDVSRSRASAMGLRVTKDVKDYLQGTPVLVSVDITRKMNKLRLDGIIRTVLSLSCYRCAKPAAESIFSNFSLLLTEEPIKKPEVINIGEMYGEVKAGTANEEDEVDQDDMIYFPPEEKEIDISKHIRDLVHLEIIINAVCDPSCKGLCLRCGTNLNTSICNCGKEEVTDVRFGPLGKLRKQMQHK